jgi:hypothetical protein
MLGKKTSRKTAISNNPNIPKWIVITFTWSLSNLFLKLEIFILNIPDKMFQLFMQRYLYFLKILTILHLHFHHLMLKYGLKRFDYINFILL